jgi:hypothetical protein
VRRIALIAAALAALSGCGGEATITKKQEKAPVTVADWQTDANVACLRIQNAFVDRTPRDLRALRKRAPALARETRGASKEIHDAGQPPGDANVERFVAALDPVEASVASLVKASRRMKTDPLTTATRRVDAKFAALAKSARRAGLQCLDGGIRRTMIGAIKAPIAAERLAAIERRVLGRLRAVKDTPMPTGPEEAIDALEDEDAALRELDVPDWARAERAAFRRGCRGYRDGLHTVLDRYNSGQTTSDEQWNQLIKRPAQKCDRLMNQLWKRIGARPVHGLK